MSSSFEDGVESYYKEKESYSALLHECAAADPTEDASTNGHVGRKMFSEGEDPLAQDLSELSESLASAFSKLDIAVAKAKATNATDESRMGQPKGKAKGKK